MKWILILIILLPLASAVNVNFTYPSRINCLKNFTVSLNLTNTSQIYDVKIDFIKNGERISTIKDNGKFKSTRYYILKGSKEDNFTMSVLCSLGLTNITVKLRDEKKNIFSYSNYSSEIYKEKIKNNTLNKQNNSLVNNSRVVQNKNLTNKTDFENNSEDKSSIKIQYTPNLKQNNKIETINLNPKTIKTGKSKNVLKGNYARVFLGIFCAFILFVYLKQNRKNKNEFR